MMVDKSPFIQNLPNFLNKLSEATDVIENLNQHPDASNYEYERLTKILETINATVEENPSYLIKNPKPDKIQENITKAIAAVLQFRKLHPEGQKNIVMQAMASLTASRKEVNKFHTNLKSLIQRIKLGQMVVKSEGTKQSGS